MRILSLDLGSKSLGISISDESNIIAIPLENFTFEKNNYQSALKKILDLTKTYKIYKILLGYPLRTDGKKSEMTFAVEKFNEALKKILDDEIIIKLFDERFSTKRGIELLKMNNKYKKNINEYKDMAASYVMLVDYLNHHF
ncbi:MAG: putative pre-16S rRNA nuclease [Candidatus Tyloplasma litorale]|nr:MAG: putative pre-16S rRNA nuclease [Mycoplasmatales bacterium]